MEVCAPYVYDTWFVCERVVVHTYTMYMQNETTFSFILKEQQQYRKYTHTNTVQYSTHSVLLEEKRFNRRRK